MEFKLIIDKDAPERIVATVHDRSPLTDQIQQLVMQHTGIDRLTDYLEDELRQIPIQDIVCITVLGGKTYAVDLHSRHYRLKQRLYELEQQLPQPLSGSTKAPLPTRAGWNGSIPLSAAVWTRSFKAAIGSMFPAGALPKSKGGTVNEKVFSRIL